VAQLGISFFIKFIHIMETTIVKINDVKIIQIGKDLIPIKPICEALGINSKAQIDKIKSDDFFKPSGVLNTSVGGDEKNREMFCLPIKYIFGWLCTINPKNVKEEAKENVTLYRKKCYDILYDNLFLHQIYLQEKEIKIENQLQELEAIRTNFKEAKKNLDNANAVLKEIRHFGFEEWKLQRNQISMLDDENFNFGSENIRPQD
jgi:hypothetical protein